MIQSSQQKEGMHKNFFRIEQFIMILILVRSFAQLYPFPIFVSLIIFLFIFKYFKEGYKPNTFLLLIAFLTIILGQGYEKKSMVFLSVVIVGLIYVFRSSSYYLPIRNKSVGMKEGVLSNELYFVEFYPLEQKNPKQQKKVSWGHSRQIEKMILHIGIQNRFLVSVIKIWLSYTNFYFFGVSEGKQEASESDMIFSHGRGATPFLYTQFLLHQAEHGMKVVAVQHSQRSKLEQIQTFEEKKVFREKEVQIRASEICRAVQNSKKKNIVLMGHSYGCATIIQAYHQLNQNHKERISHLVLLDPWFFPLPDKIFTKKIAPSILMLANQDFIEHQDMYERNLKFISTHKVDYICWKNGHHLHQTDLGYIVGDMLWIIKNHKLTDVMIVNNIKAIQMFLLGKTAEGNFDDFDLRRNHKPKIFKPFNSFSF